MDNLQSYILLEVISCDIFLNNKILFVKFFYTYFWRNITNLISREKEKGKNRMRRYWLKFLKYLQEQNVRTAWCQRITLLYAENDTGLRR